MNAERPTPETDAYYSVRNHWPNDAAFARRLERERDESREQRDEAVNRARRVAEENYKRVVSERDALREALDGIISIGKRDMSNTKYDGYFSTARAILEQTKPKP